MKNWLGTGVREGRVKKFRSPDKDGPEKDMPWWKPQFTLISDLVGKLFSPNLGFLLFTQSRANSWENVGRKKGNI